MLRTQHGSCIISDCRTCSIRVFWEGHLILKKYSKAAADLPVNRIDLTRIKIGLFLPMVSFPIFPV
mgnify:CR=1 FL=1